MIERPRLPENSGASSAALFRVMAIRFARHGTGALGGAAFIMCGMPVLFLGIIWLVEPRTAEKFVDNPPDILLPMFGVGEWIVLTGLLLFELVHVRPLYVLPITNRQIVNIQLSLGTIAAIALHWFFVLFYWVMFGAKLPVWGPLLFLCPAIVAAAGLSALVIDFRWWRPFLVPAVVVAALALGAILPFRPWQASFGPSWLTPSPREFLCIMILAVIGYGLALRGVGLDRCGETGAWPDFDTLLQRWAARLSGLSGATIAKAPYRSGLLAQVWFEFWQKGLLPPIILSSLLGLSMIAAYQNPTSWIHGLAKGLPSFVIAIAILTGITAGMVNIGRKGTTRGLMINEYRATRPLTDGQLARAGLIAALLSSIVMLAIVGMFAIIVAGWCLWTTHSGIPKLAWSVPAASGLSGLSGYLLVLLVAAVVGWGLMGLVASAMMTGRLWVVWLPLLLVIAAMLQRRGIVPPSLTPEEMQARAQRMLAILTLSLACAAAGAFLVAYRKRLFFLRNVWTGLILWLATAGGLTGLLLLVGEIGVMELTGIALLATLASAPLATAPLAISWNRHR